MTPKHVMQRVENGIGIVTLDNPPVNSLNTPVLRELEITFEELENNSQLRGVVITGSGRKSFCAGADIRAMSSSQDEIIELIRTGQTVFDKIERFDRPVIAAINGVALGGGNELALTCDIRISSDLARFSQPEVSLGLIPAWGGTRRLARLVGLGLAKELILTGRTIDAQEALRIGLVNKVVPDEEQLTSSMEMMGRISSAAPLAIIAAKKAFADGEVDSELRAMKDLVETSDLKEGVEAFLQKRSPRFQGK